MGISFSSRRHAQSDTTLADVLIAVPDLLDRLDIRGLRSLAMASRDLRQVMGQPDIWKKQFAKEVGTEPRFLPDPPAHIGIVVNDNVNLTPAFKTLCRGLAVLEFEADHPEQQVRHDLLHRLLRAKSLDYLNQHADSLVREFDARQMRIQLHREVVNDRKLVAVMCGVGTGVCGGLMAGQVYMLAYTTFDSITLMDVCMTVGLADQIGRCLLEIRRERRIHAAELQRARAQARIDAGRQLRNANEAQR